MEFRAGSPPDADAIAGLIASFQSELTDDPSGAGAEEYLASVSVRAEREYLASARYRYLLAYAGSQLVGFIAIRDGSHLFHLFVERAHQRQGIARLLWERALRELCAPSSEGTFTVNSSLSAVPGVGFPSCWVNNKRPWHLVPSYATPRFTSVRPNPSLPERPPILSDI